MNHSLDAASEGAGQAGKIAPAPLPDEHEGRFFPVFPLFVGREEGFDPLSRFQGADKEEIFSGETVFRSDLFEFVPVLAGMEKGGIHSRWGDTDFFRGDAINLRNLVPGEFGNGQDGFGPFQGRGNEPGKKTLVFRLRLVGIPQIGEVVDDQGGRFPPCGVGDEVREEVNVPPPGEEVEGKGNPQLQTGLQRLPGKQGVKPDRDIPAGHPFGDSFAFQETKEDQADVIVRE